MRLVAVGVGPGDPDLITLAALKAIGAADLVIVPLSAPGRESVAEGIVRAHQPDVKTLPLVFPMVHDGATRDARLVQQLKTTRNQWETAATVAMPVIGDSALYATASWLYDVWRMLVPDLELSLVPGVSAHSLAASRAATFLAMGDDVLSVVPATAPPKRVLAALRAADSVALYKPMALRDCLRSVVADSGPWRRVVRVDRAGLTGERILTGDEALEPAAEYLSTLLLWR